MVVVGTYPMDRKLPSEFYLRDTIEVARALLGKKMVHVLPGGRRLSGIIVETEAYLGVEDPAAHSFGGRLTERTAAMYEGGGISYIYFIYGMYYCFNVVTGHPGHPEAVLIRALEPLEGVELMQTLHAHPRPPHELANGPGKLCQALRLDKTLNRVSLLSDNLYIAEARDVMESEIEESPRVGVGYAADAALWPLRFFVRGHAAVSKARTM
jgi:DNA-3-methyladenine glycosylase